jgi:uncharacterized cofD-like protein
MTQPGETDGLTLNDHLSVIREHTSRNLFDYILVNRAAPAPEQLARYRGEGAELVRREKQLPAAEGARVIEMDLLDTNCDQVRHDSQKLAAAILQIAKRRGHRVPAPVSPPRIS